MGQHVCQFTNNSGHYFCGVAGGWREEVGKNYT